MNPTTFESPTVFGALVREHLTMCPDAKPHGKGNVAVVGGQRLWVCGHCSARITARGFGFFAGWVEPGGLDHGRQCVGGCGEWFHCLRPSGVGSNHLTTPPLSNQRVTSESP